MLYYKNKKYLNINEWVKQINALYGKYGIKVQPRDVHQLFHHYHLTPLKTNSKREISPNGNITWFSESSFNTVRFKEDFMNVLSNIINFGDARGEESLKQNVTPNNKENVTYKNDEDNMEKYSHYLEKQYQTENKKGFKTIILNENSFKKLFENLENEDVFINRIDNKNKKMGLKYNKFQGRNRGNLNSLDMIKTDKMDADNNDTYEVPLKGGIMSYNITSINGTEVMHYFKRHFQKQKTYVKYNEEDYELEMQDFEFREFMKQFVNKVNTVVSNKINEFQTEDNPITNISIFPVPSSSNFNVEMAKRMSFNTICGFKPNIVNQNLLVKNLQKLQKDDDFINKNLDYYNSQYSQSLPSNKTHIDSLNKELNRFKSINKASIAIEHANNCAKA